MCAAGEKDEIGGEGVGSGLPLLPWRPHPAAAAAAAAAAAGASGGSEPVCSLEETRGAPRADSACHN